MPPVRLSGRHQEPMDIIIAAEVAPADNSSAIVDGRGAFQRPAGTRWQKVLQVFVTEIVLPDKGAVVDGVRKNARTVMKEGNQNPTAISNSWCVLEARRHPGSLQ